MTKIYFLILNILQSQNCWFFKCVPFSFIKVINTFSFCISSFDITIYSNFCFLKYSTKCVLCTRLCAMTNLMYFLSSGHFRYSLSNFINRRIEARRGAGVENECAGSLCAASPLSVWGCMIACDSHPWEETQGRALSSVLHAASYTSFTRLVPQKLMVNFLQNESRTQPHPSKLQCVSKKQIFYDSVISENTSESK